MPIQRYVDLTYAQQQQDKAMSIHKGCVKHEFRLGVYSKQVSSTQFSLTL